MISGRDRVSEEAKIYIGYEKVESKCIYDDEHAGNYSL